MDKVFVVSDTHFGHSNIIKHHRSHRFNSVEHMEEELIKAWNETVGKDDLVYHLGDITYGGNQLKAIKILEKLNGRKILILGNHDYLDTSIYKKYFESVQVSKLLFIDGRRVLLTHYPIHECEKPYYFCNIHGHIHSHAIKDSWWKNVSVEAIDFKPKELEKVMFDK